MQAKAASISESRGNPYGISLASAGADAVSGRRADAARHQGARLADYAGKILKREDEEDVAAEAAEAYRNA